MQSSADFVLFNAGQLLTMASGREPLRGPRLRQIRILQDGGIAVGQGKILEVGKSSYIRRKFRANKEFDAGGRVVSPGFVDPHTHIVYAGDRLDEFELRIQGADYLEILHAGGGIISTVQKTRMATSDELVGEGMRRLDKMLACGTTTAEIKTGYGLDTQSELRMLRVIEELDKQHRVDIVPTFLPAHAIPTEYRERPDHYVDLVCREMIPAAWNWYRTSRFFAKRVPFFADVFCEKNAFDARQLRQILETACDLGFRLKAHTDEFTNLGASRVAIELGATSIDHLDEITVEDIEQLAASKTVAVVTPTVNFNSGALKFANARALIDTGCAVALSTDFNPGSAPCPSMPMAIAIACRYQRLLPSEAFASATINAAHAIGLGESVGSLEPGKSADFVVFDCNDFRQIAYEFGGSLILKVFKRGTEILRDQIDE